MKAQGICWLYCWVETGQGSAKAKRHAGDTFDRIFDPGYDRLHRRLSLEMARKLRYTPHDVEQEFLDAIACGSDET